MREHRRSRRLVSNNRTVGLTLSSPVIRMLECDHFQKQRNLLEVSETPRNCPIEQVSFVNFCFSEPCSQCARITRCQLKWLQYQNWTSQAELHQGNDLSVICGNFFALINTSKNMLCAWLATFFCQRNTTVDLNTNNFETPADMTAWPSFHNGVAAGLRIADSSQVRVVKDEDFLAALVVVQHLLRISVVCLMGLGSFSCQPFLS